jgi:hypothetical protein
MRRLRLATSVTPLRESADAQGLEPTTRIELVTYGLRNRCSTD